MPNYSLENATKIFKAKYTKLSKDMFNEKNSLFRFIEMGEDFEKAIKPLLEKYECSSVKEFMRRLLWVKIPQYPKNRKAWTQNIYNKWFHA